MTAIAFGQRRIGDGAPAYVIAEAGANHNRDLGIARKLIDVAVEAGADAVKFQTYSGKSLYSTKTPKFEYLGELGAQPAHELLESISLPRDWQPILAGHCRDVGIDFLSTPFDNAAVDELDALDVPAFKVASFEIVDLQLIAYIAATGRPIIFSTGMATIAEIDEALTAARDAGGSSFALLQCASLYPAPPAIINLRAMDTMRAAFDLPVGLSDHTLGTHVSVAAVARGAAIIEKHFTLDRTSTGPDHPFAIEPDELSRLVREIRDIEAALGNGRKEGPSGPEAQEMYTKARRSLIAASSIPAGTVISAEMLTVKRPGTGIRPKFFDAVVGRTAAVDIEPDDILTWDML